MNEEELLALLDKCLDEAIQAEEADRRTLKSAHQFMQWAIKQGRVTDQEGLTRLWKGILHGKRPWNTKTHWDGMGPCPEGPKGIEGTAGRRREIPVLCLGRDPLPAGAVYAGRPGPLGNAYQIGPDGDRAEVIRKFEVDFHARLRIDGKYKDYLSSLRDVPALYCHCPKPLACHAQIIARYLESLP